MKILAAPLLALAISLASLFQARAWSGAGHQVIAAQAYRQLSPATKTKVTNLLKAHPDYERWSQALESQSTNLDLGLMIFMRASSWPDEIRRRGNPYDHAEWHYIDYPLRPPAFSLGPGPAPTNDVLYGIAQCEKVLSDKKASPEKRAAYLSWLIHLIGDLHQPLHCSSFFNDSYPNGDKGGNSFYIKPATRGISLHSFWDGLLGTSGSTTAHLNYATRIAAEYPRASLPELKKDRTPKQWSLESRAIAVDKAYLRGELKGSTKAQDAIELPDGYSKEAKVVAERQAAVAAYRLADEIQKYLK